jgi:hypothetical protein
VSLVAQIQIGHFPLNAYLHKIGKAISELCDKCGEEGDGSRVKETIKHFIFDCDAYTVARNKLTVKIEADNLNMEGIVSTAKRMKALVKYIRRTRRFKNDENPQQ